jgi:hypothetical protein
MPELNRALARDIVTECIAIETAFTQRQILESMSMDGLGLDSDARRRTYKRIVDEVKAFGWRTSFSFDAFSSARTVGDVMDALIVATDSGGPR